MSVSPPPSTKINTNVDDVSTTLPAKRPRKNTFLKSRRCKILLILQILLIVCMIALFATTYTIAFTATKTSTTIASTTASTASVPTYQLITSSSDSITAIYDATAGGSSLNSNSGYGIGDYPPGQGANEAIDFSNTTYVNFGNIGQNISFATNTAGVGTGVNTVPAVGPTVVLAIQFQAGNDSSNRDPLTITLEGTNSTGTSLNTGSVWTLLYSGPTGLAPFSITRLAWGDPQNITNTQAYIGYRMIVTSQRGVDDCVEIAEMHLYGLV